MAPAPDRWSGRTTDRASPRRAPPCSGAPSPNAPEERGRGRNRAGAGDCVLVTKWRVNAALSVHEGVRRHRSFTAGCPYSQVQPVPATPAGAAPSRDKVCKAPTGTSQRPPLGTELLTPGASSRVARVPALSPVREVTQWPSRGREHLLATPSPVDSPPDSTPTAHSLLLSCQFAYRNRPGAPHDRQLRESDLHAREHNCSSAADCTHPPCHALRNGRYRRCSRTGPVRLFVARVDGIRRDGNRRRLHSHRHGFLSVR